MTVKVPPELEAETVQVIYRSTLCTVTGYSAMDGKSYTRDSYQGTSIQLIRQGQSDIHEARFAVDGGGSCQWRLSNVTFGVAYSDPTRFGENVTYGAGGGVVVIFDHDNSWRGGADFEVDGDVVIRKDYYPWVKENFLGGYSKRVSLAGEGDIYLMYRALQAREVYFEPVLHSDFVVYSAGPKVKKDGNYPTYRYPDGSVLTEARSEPNFRKLQAMRLSAEGQQ
ncbi:hypothetical protein D3C76_395760 [compost metagenome]